jgi:uncharacterized damage-inducible protein DinB
MDLQTLFDYDLWANRRWVESLAAQNWQEPERKVFVHILGASTIWITRIEGESLPAIPEPEPTEETLQNLRARWHKALTAIDPNHVIHFKRTNGDANSLPLEAIATHVINHGTYHRGEMRGLARAAGRDDFPETDFALFAIINKPG